MIELARHAGQPVQEGRLTADDLRRAAEVLVTSTAGGIMPVTVIDGHPVGTGAPGPLTLQLGDRYWASHEDPQYSTPVRYDEPDWSFHQDGSSPVTPAGRSSRVRAGQAGWGSGWWSAR